MSVVVGRRLAVVATLCLFMLVRIGRAGSGQPSAASTPAFVGAQACASCHRDMHDTWLSGRGRNGSPLLNPSVGFVAMPADPGKPDGQQQEYGSDKQTVQRPH